MFTSEQKSQLAKLLATENLSIQHQKIRTAKFDPTNRVLYLPIWQNMSSSLYDLLVGHEVGHALYTPAEGWHDAVTGPNKHKNYKGFLNVVEDARIEKKVQRKYPGLKKQFNQAYKELIDRDFFGTKGLDINNLAFIDRLNIYSKSQWSNFTISFSEEENELIGKVRAAETWEDVLKITEAIFDYSKDEQKEAKVEQFEQIIADQNSEDLYDADYGDDDEDGDGDEFEYDEADEFDEDYDPEESDSYENSLSEENEENEENEEYDPLRSELNRYKNSKESWKQEFEPECQTDEKFRKNENVLLDEKCKDVVYISIPKPKLKNIITPAKVVHEIHDAYVKEYIERQYLDPNVPNKLLNEFKNRNERYVSLLVKEFEMRKAARSYNKSKISDTGDIDINKLSSYKFDDNIFRKITTVPKGKSHGLVLLLDKSGSMSDNMAGSIEQILVLTMFCRKVNIPFVVYGFGNSDEVKMIDNLKQSIVESEEFLFSNFTRNDGELKIGKVYMREYLNSKMNNAEFTRAMKNMLLIKKSFESHYSRYLEDAVPRFPSEDLSNTPLIETIIATAEIMKNFKKKNNLEIANLVIVHDGDADYVSSYHTTKTNSITGEPFKANIHIDTYSNNCFLQDVQNKYVSKLKEDHDTVYHTILDWFTKTTGSKIFGFFICEGRQSMKNAIENRFYVNEVQVKQLARKNFFQYQEFIKEKLKIIKSEKFLEANHPGFSSFFLIVGGSELKTENEELEVGENATTKTLVRAFMKFNKKKSVNRILVSKFIQGIAA